MDKLFNMAKNKIKNIILKYLWGAIKPVLLAFLPYLVIIALVMIVVLSIFGAAPSQEIEGKTQVKNYVESIKTDVISKYQQEKDFRLPWGIVYAVEEYVNGWNKDVNMNRVKVITDMLKPEFMYMDYIEKVVKTTYEVDYRGNKIVKKEVTEIPVKLLTQVRTYEGIYVFEYKEVTDTKDNISHTYLAVQSMDFSEDYSKLDSVISNEVGLNNLGNANVKSVDLSPGKLAWPVPSSHTITSPFGMRFHPVSGTYKMHTGIDIAANAGDEIDTAADGVVRIAGPYGGYGNAVLIDHGGGISTLYGHNSEVLVKVGDVVKQGQKIALAGSTGVSTGPHCHFEVRKNGIPVNPFDNINVSGGTVLFDNNIDRKLIIESGIAFMEGGQNLDWLLDNNISGNSGYTSDIGKVPDVLLPVFKDAGNKYGIPWYVLAAIAFRESSFNPNAIGPYLPELNTRALGMMQFLQSTFDEYAVDGNENGVKSPFEAEDAVYTAARYLSANENVYLRKGYDAVQALRYSIWNYNHAWWYVDQVMAIADKYKNNY